MTVRRISRKDALHMAKYCASSNLRRVARAVSRHYDRDLASAGVTSTQLPVLAAISAGYNGSIAALAESLDLERSTVSREVAILVRRELVTMETPDDKRITSLQLTPQGEAVLAKGLRAWHRAHDVIIEAFGADPYEALLAAANRLADAVEDHPRPRTRNR